MGEPRGRDGSVPLLVNRSAGRRGKRAERRLRAVLGMSGVPHALHRVDPEEIEAEVRRLADRGEEVVSLAGGDGSLLGAADVLAGRRTALAPFPTGTLNHFARRLGTTSLSRAVQALAGGRIESVPLGVLDDRVFLDTATFGAYAGVVRRREHYRRWLWKWPAAALALAATVLRMREMEVEIETEGRRFRFISPLVWVGVQWEKEPLWSGVLPHPGEAPQLVVVVLRLRGTRETLPVLGRLVVRLARRERPDRDSAVEVVRARRLLLRAPDPVEVTLDGEVFRFRSPLWLAVQEGALRVVAPPA